AVSAKGPVSTEDPCQKAIRAESANPAYSRTARAILEYLTYGRDVLGAMTEDGQNPKVSLLSNFGSKDLPTHLYVVEGALYVDGPNGTTTFEHRKLLATAI